MSRPTLALLAAGAALVTAAPVAATATAAAGGPTATSASARVTVKDNRFSPSHVTIRRGGKVTWLWSRRNGQPHNVTARRFGSSTRVRGYRYAHRFNRRGSFVVVCTVHSGMSMRVRVK